MEARAVQNDLISEMEKDIVNSFEVFESSKNHAPTSDEIVDFNYRRGPPELNEK